MGGEFGQRKGSGEGQVAEVLRSRGLGTGWHSRLFLSFQFNQPSSQTSMAASAIHQGWAHGDGQGSSSTPLRRSKSRGRVT